MAEIEIRVSDNGKVAVLFSESIRYHSDLIGQSQGKHWRALEWAAHSDLTMHAFTDDDVADWRVVYREEG